MKLVQSIKNMYKTFFPPTINILNRETEKIHKDLEDTKIFFHNELNNKNEKIHALLKDNALRINTFEKQIVRMEKIQKLNTLRISSKIAFANPATLPEIKEYRKEKVIVSLTTFPDRDFEVDVVIYSLLMQSMLPDKIILWLSYEEYPGGYDNLPEYLKKLTQFGIEILFCENIYSYKKLIPALQLYPNDVIVTADDDIFYPSNWLKLLYDEYLNNKKYIHAHRVHRVLLDDDKNILPYREWEQCIKGECTSANFTNFFTTGGGVLFPPNSLNADINKVHMFLELCPTADDLWVWVQSLLKGTKINVVSKNIRGITELGLDQSYPKLWSINGSHGRNDEQLKILLGKYPQLMKLILEDSGVMID